MTKRKINEEFDKETNYFFERHNGAIIGAGYNKIKLEIYPGEKYDAFFEFMSKFESAGRQIENIIVTPSGFQFQLEGSVLCLDFLKLKNKDVTFYI